MATVEFTKYHGCGNDFIIVDARRPGTGGVQWARAARAWCPRHTGIGADQLLVIIPPRAGADAGLRVFNADGTEASMCGNGLRCAARHLMELAGGRASSVTVSIGERVFPIVVRSSGGRFRAATVHLGEPSFDAAAVPVRGRGEAVAMRPPGAVGAALRRAGYEPLLTCVHTGNPHAVCFSALPTPPADELEHLTRAGAFIETHPMFPRRTNVQFVTVLSRSRLRVRSWERGSGITLACGSGACAAVAAAARLGLAARRARVDLLGGVVRVEWGRDGLRLTGPAERVFRGTAQV
ncbi:MAG: diaminopimelate epimerase [Phycisphaerae bacterium]|nr:diaminopimelate epimerase [Phycisphaerae bacterium]